MTADKSDADVCIFPNCKSLKFIESDGKIHPYCGQTHANLAKQLGIFGEQSRIDCTVIMNNNATITLHYD